MPDPRVEVVEAKWQENLAKESARRLSLLLFMASQEREGVERGEVQQEGEEDAA